MKLFRGNRSRSEVVATFLAVLELCRLKSVVLEENEDTEEMSVRFVKMPDEAVPQEEGGASFGGE